MTEEEILRNAYKEVLKLKELTSWLTISEGGSVDIQMNFDGGCVVGTFINDHGWTTLEDSFEVSYLQICTDETGSTGSLETMGCYTEKELKGA